MEDMRRNLKTKWVELLWINIRVHFLSIEDQWMKYVFNKYIHLLISSPGSLTKADKMRKDISLKSLSDYGGVRKN